MPMNERIGYDNANYFANCSQNSAPYANAPINNSASYVTINSSQTNENSIRCANGNTHDLASYVAPSLAESIKGGYIIILMIQLHVLLVARTKSMKT